MRIVFLWLALGLFFVAVLANDVWATLAGLACMILFIAVGKE